jgi:methionyl-tRNA synthetase
LFPIGAGAVRASAHSPCFCPVSVSRLYLTTPIYYVNGDPHIGHAHTTVTGDVLKRIAQMRGERVFLTTGTDEHGQKNQEAAESSGLATREYLDRQSARFRDVFDRLTVDYDFFVRTTRPEHVAAVAEVLRRLWDKGLIVKKMYKGLYCVGCEQFKKPSDLDEEGRCPDHVIVPVESEEENYFLVLAPFQEWLVRFISERDDVIAPSFFRREILAMLEEPLDDLSISRPKSRVSLGVDLPFDSAYVTYVWFDALINYVSSLGWPQDHERVATWWPVSAHLMAKDIIKTHCIYWPIMLRALGLEPPRQYLVHGYWVGEGGRKMSKSLSNAVDPVELLNVIGADGLRYYLMKNMTTGDSTISARLVIQTYNTDLANSIGNLYSRVVKFAADGVPNLSLMHSADADLVEECAAIATAALASVDFESLPTLPKTVLEIATRLNAHVDAVAPWQLARDPSNRERLNSAILALLEGLRLLGELAWPVMPQTSDRMLAALGAPPMQPSGSPVQFAPFRLTRGGAVSPLDGPLFPRVRPAVTQ